MKGRNMVTKTEALDHLVDVLAGTDVEASDTVAGAIDQLATKIENGEIAIGGGGSTSDALEIVLGNDQENFGHATISGATWEEVEAAYVAGTEIRATFEFDGLLVQPTDPEDEYDQGTYFKGEFSAPVVKDNGQGIGHGPEFWFDVPVAANGNADGAARYFRVSMQENYGWDDETQTEVVSHYLGWDYGEIVAPKVVDAVFYHDNDTDTVEVAGNDYEQLFSDLVRARWRDEDGYTMRDLTRVGHSEYQNIRVDNNELRVTTFTFSYDGGAVVTYDEQTYQLTPTL